uniref:Aminotransferase-like plant mobile domain-containing protein n=1 Tax=Fagus sylvatica TaxID=28930 RepID=A0A2N9GFM3_FAGSY
MLSANREFHVVAGVIIFPTHPGSRINLLRAGKTLRAKAAVREKKCVLLPARFFSNLVPVPDSRESELGLVRYGPASRVHRGVFGPFEGSFPIGIPASPDKFLAIREFHVVHGMCLLSNVPGLADQLVASQEDSVRKRGNVGGKIPELSAKPYFVGLFSRAWPCTEASLGSQDMILRTEAVGMFLMPRVLATTLSFLVRFRPVKYGIEALDILYTLVKGWSVRFQFSGLVNGPVKPWSNLVNLGQTWSNLVKALQTLGNVSRTSFQGFLGTVGPSRVWKRLGQTSVKLWSTLVKLDRAGSVRAVPFCAPTPEKIPTLIDDQSSPTRPIGPVLFRLGTRVSPAMQKNFNLSWKFFQMVGENWGLKLVKPQLDNQTWLGNSSKRSGTNWDLTLSRIAIGCLIEVAVAEGHRRSDRLAKGKSVAYAPESSPDTDDEYDAMEDVRTRLDASLARNLQAELDAEAAGLAPSAARAPPRPGVVIGRSAGPSETTRPSPQPGVTTGPSDAPSAAPRRAHTRSTGILPSRLKRQRTEGIPDSAGTIPEDYVAPGFRYPPHGGHSDREPPYSAGRGGWSEFSRLLAVSRPEYREFLIELGFGPFLSIPYVSVYHPAVWCFIERFFHHTGTFHLSTCEMAVLPVDWSAILGIRFGGRAPPSEPIDGFEAREILGLADRDAIEGTRRPSVRIRHLADVLRRDREEPPTELRYRQWAAYFIFSCFLGNDRSIVPTPIVGMFRDIDTLREYDWGALTYGFYIRGLRRYSRRESISFLGFWQFTVFWAFEHFPTFAPSRLPDADIIFQPYSAALSQRPEVFRAVALSCLRLWIRTTRSWELLLGERTVRQLGDEAVVPVDPSPLMTIEDYIPRAPSDPYIAGVEGGRVMGGVAMDSHHIRSSGQIERLESEILRLQLELSVSVDRHTADMDRVQGEMASMQTEATRREGEMVQMQRDLAQSQRDLGSRDAALAAQAATIRRLEDQLHGMGITPVTGADPSGLGQPSSSPPRDPVSRDWFFDDPSPP